MYYPQELIEEIRMQNDIVDVISEYVPLKKKGSSYFGLCPFHNEGTPSFSVTPEKQFYYCFGCGAAGNVYSFIMQMDNCDFVEAVKKLADRAHITLPENGFTPQAKEAERLRQILFEIHKTAGLFYYNMLHSKEGEQALQYLNGRKVMPNIQKKFGLGFAPAGRDKLYHHLEEKGYSIDAMLKSGLIMEDKRGRGYYDRFFNRLMFPIFDVQGRTIAFGGRIMESGQPKYLNSPETMLFSKSKNMYGLNFARAAKRQELIIVEGYMDMISIYQAGFHNVAASLGTAFNDEHAKVLKKFVTDVILLFDSDEAGTTAALRAIPHLVQNGFRVKVLQVPDGKDPDEFIKQNGSMEFSKLLVNAVSYITFEISCIQKKYNMQNAEHRVLFTTEAAKVLSALDNDIERDVYVKEVAKMTDISSEAIENEIRKIRNKADEIFQAEADKKRLKIYRDTSVSVRKSKGISEAQRDILYLCATDLAVYRKVKEYLKPEDYAEAVYSRVAALLYEAGEKGQTVFPAELLNYFGDLEEQKKVTEIFAVRMDYENKKDLEKALNEEVRLIKKTRIDAMAAEALDVESIKRIVEEKKMLEKIEISL